MKHKNKIEINLTLNDISLKRFKTTPTFTNLLFPNQLANLKVGDNKLIVNHTTFGSLQRLASVGNYIISKLESIEETNFSVTDDKLTDFMAKTKGKLTKDDTVSVGDEKKSSTSYSSSSDLSEDITSKPERLKYLSNVKDSSNGEISKPFNKDGKNYQMVRCLGNDKKIGMGVYSLDETDDTGENLIYSLEEFEGRFNQPEPVKQEQSVKQQTNLNPLNLSEFKHFFVDKTTGKMRKFKTDEELAKATIGDNEAYMKIHDLKKFMDETIFGNRRKPLTEFSLNEEEDENELHAKVAKLMKLISTKIPSQVIETIKTNKLAQREVILSFAELIGVPRTNINSIITGIKAQSKIDSNPQQTQQQDQQQVTENRLLKKKDLEKSVIPKTIKVKNFKNGL